jgi:hypothetical protein
MNTYERIVGYTGITSCTLLLIRLFLSTGTVTGTGPDTIYGILNMLPLMMINLIVCGAFLAEPAFKKLYNNNIKEL